jgi:pterin-4a-carbinolamine dehydratase
MLCRPRNYGSAANKFAWDFQRHKKCDKLKKAIRFENFSAKVKNFFTLSERKSDDAVLVAEGAFFSYR